MITTLAELYAALDELFCGISSVCQSCRDDDCAGYLWLLPEEAEILYESGVGLLEINESLTFISPFGEGEPIDVERVKPPCPWCQDRRCTIRSLRPLVCRMYPLNFVVENGTIYLVLQLDCEYARQRENDAGFHQQAVELFRRLDHQLFSRILDTFRRVDAISKFPVGPNRYLRLIDIKHLESRLQKKGGEWR